METLNENDFKKIYSDEKFRNEVAFASNCCDKHGDHLYFKAFYPISYIITDEQKNEALKELDRAKKELISNYKKGELIFKAMGGDFESGHSDIGNHRIRANFKNKEGRSFFIELLSSKKGFYCDFSIDKDLEGGYNKKLSECYDEMEKVGRFSPEWERLDIKRNKYLEQPYYNAFGIEHKSFDCDFTKENVLKLVNDTFNCSYNTLRVDRYTLSPDDICSECY